MHFHMRTILQPIKHCVKQFLYTWSIEDVAYIMETLPIDGI